MVIEIKYVFNKICISNERNNKLKSPYENIIKTTRKGSLN